MSTRQSRQRRRELEIEDYVEGIRSGDRAVLARAITLVESQRRDAVGRAQQLLARLLPATGRAFRVGISGAPGVGKSTFIDSLGMQLIARGLRVAVLAVDPTSPISGGSILGDKSRMPRLSASEQAFIRPSPSALTPGGVGRRTRESLLLCEAAGSDVVLVETVGVGQAETLVADMVDFFLVLLLPGAGDELQGIKKGILELADLLAVNKADGDHLHQARVAERDYRTALRYLRPRASSWQPTVIAVSGLQGTGLAELWGLIEKHHRILTDNGELEQRRRQQAQRWMWSLIEERLQSTFREDPGVRTRLPKLEQAVREGLTTPTQAAAELLEIFAQGAHREPSPEPD
jgi:LAO/AO transport system kinase